MIEDVIKSMQERLSTDSKFDVEIDGKLHHTSLDSNIRDFFVKFGERFWQFKDQIIDVNLLRKDWTFRTIGMIPTFSKAETAIKISPTNISFKIIGLQGNKEIFSYNSKINPVTTYGSEFKKAIKEQIDNDLELPNYKMKIYLPDQTEWRDNTTLNYCKIWSKERIITIKISYPKPSTNDAIIIYVKTLTGKVMDMKMSLNDRIGDLKKKIEEKEKIPSNQQTICYNGKKWDDEDTLAEMGVSDHSTVMLILRLCGGMYHETSGRDGFNLLHPEYLGYFSYNKVKMSAEDYEYLDQLLQKEDLSGELKEKIKTLRG